MAKPLNVAAPLASVVAVALLSVAPAGPDAITAVTGTPAPPAGLPAPSRTWSTSCGENAAPQSAVGDGSRLLVGWFAAPALSVIVEDVARLSLAHSHRNVHSPSTTLFRSPLNVAAPLASVVAVALLSVAPAGPDAITAVTGTPAPPAGLPAPSRTWSTGCWLNGAPLAAVADGSVVIVSWVAVPAPRVIVPDVAG